MKTVIVKSYLLLPQPKDPVTIKYEINQQLQTVNYRTGCCNDDDDDDDGSGGGGSDSGSAGGGGNHDEDNINNNNNNKNNNDDDDDNNNNNNNNRSNNNNFNNRESNQIRISQLLHHRGRRRIQRTKRSDNTKKEGIHHTKPRF